MRNTTTAVVVTALAVALACPSGVTQTHSTERWERTIQRFEEADKAAPAPENPIVFAGSSSIRMWDLGRWFPDLPAVNRGFGGSVYKDLIAFKERIVIPYKPATLVIYSGDNDVASGLGADAVFADFKAFVEAVHASLSGTKILLIPIKPSVARWSMWPTMQKVNEKMKAFALEREWITYMDMVTPLLGEDGNPRADLLLNDGLHLNDEGYKIWTAIVRSHLGAAEVTSPK